MNKLKLNANVILRSPRFPFNATLKDCWQELKKAIQEASPEFYKRIETFSYEDLTKSEKKLKETVTKYFNRAKFRSTPFGSFATLGMATLADNATQIQLGSTIKIHQFPCWKTREKYPKFSKQDCQHSDLKFFSNTSFYQVGQEIRYLKKENDVFQLAAITFDPDIEQLLLICQVPKTFKEIGRIIPTLKGANLFNLLTDLVDIQLLLTSQHGNILGKDYFQRIPLSSNEMHQPYIIAERKTERGCLAKNVFGFLPALALKLQQLNAPVSNDLLDKFINDFNGKFEGQEILLMVALDPEIGIGYGNFANHQPDRITDTFMQKGTVAQSAKLSEYASQIINHIINARSTFSVIDLEHILPGTSNDKPLPNSVGVLCTEIDGKVYLDSMGGVTANALSGRFAFAIPEIAEHCKVVAHLEENANQDVLFFDIGYTQEENADDINRRPSIYSYQLNILNFDTTQSPLSVHDIYVSVRNGTVILRSASLNKRIVPRFGSAYNYTRSDLSLFRFLTDLQHLGLSTNLMWRPINLVPDLKYYPRVEFRNIIVAPAMWLLEASNFKHSNTDIDEIEGLQIFLNDIANVRYFKTGNGDQTLFLDKNDPDDLSLLLSMLKQKKSLYLEEAALPKMANTCDPSGAPYLTQFNLTLFHTETIIQALPIKNEDNIIEAKQWCLPGNAWIYFEIFGNPNRLASLLSEKVRPYLALHRRVIEKWFFIRYNEGGEHIRLRIKLKNPEKSHMHTVALGKLFEIELAHGLLSDVKLRTYKREVHRYSSQLMDHVEDHFKEDSAFVLAITKYHFSELQKYWLCIETLNAIRESGTFSFSEFETIVHKMSLAFNNEFEINFQDFKEINKLHKSLQQITDPLIVKRLQIHFGKFHNSFNRILLAAEKSHRPKLFADLFHMHINRLFITDQRFMEMLVYNFIKLDIVREFKRKTNHQINDVRA